MLNHKYKEFEVCLRCFKLKTLFDTVLILIIVKQVNKSADMLRLK